ncbi:MAG: hypothetical protein ACE5FI_09455 [Anaerolineales bacterium]
MAYTVLVHIANEDPILAEMDALPEPQDQFVTLQNPRRRDGKDLHYILAEVTTVIWPISRVSFIEIMPSDEEEEVVTFVRE